MWALVRQTLAEREKFESKPDEDIGMETLHQIILAKYRQHD